MRRKVVISAISAFAVAAIVAALVVTHRDPFEAASAPAPAVPTAPVVAGSVISHDVPIYLQGVGTVIATEFLGHDVLLTIDPAGDTAPLIVRQHSLNPPPIDAKVRIEVVGTGVALR